MAASALDFVPIGANAETLPANLTEGLTVPKTSSELMP
jgi:hypothetical protein